jgi:hypothetical protein
LDFLRRVLDRTFFVGMQLQLWDSRWDFDVLVDWPLGRRTLLWLFYSHNLDTTLMVDVFLIPPLRFGMRQVRGRVRQVLLNGWFGEWQL